MAAFFPIVGLLLVAPLALWWRRRHILLSLAWPDELSPPQFGAYVAKYIRAHGVEARRLTMGGKLDDDPANDNFGIFDAIIPEAQFEGRLGSFMLVGRDSMTARGTRIYGDIRLPWVRAGRRYTVVLVVWPEVDIHIKYAADENEFAVIPLSELKSFVTALQRVRAGEPPDYRGSSEIIGRVFMAKPQAAATLDRRDEMEQLLREGRDAERAGDWGRAERAWRRFLKVETGHWAAYTSLGHALQKQDKQAEAAAVMSEVGNLFQGDVRVAAEIARFFQDRGDLAEALHRWGDVIERFPDDWLGYRGKIAAFQKAGENAKADELLLSAHPGFPRSPDAWHDMARYLERHRRWGEAESAWDSFLAVENRPSWAHAAKARAMREQGKIADALALLQSCRQRYPEAADILIETAACHEALQEWNEATLIWTSLREAQPGNCIFPRREAAALLRQQLYDQADEVLKSALSGFPRDAALHEAYGQVAVAREDWSAAELRLRQARDKFPEDNRFERRLFELGLRRADAGVTSADELPARKPTDAELQTLAIADRDLVGRFESLGGFGHGCEFGIFQRHFGAEPLGLLRWADLSQDALTQALETEFAGVGEPEFTNVFVPRSDGRPEYWTTDTRYHMAMRCFVAADDLPIDKMKKQVCRRLAFLRNKLIEDLREGSKIFVFKNMKRNLTDLELRKLHAACRRYGNNTLLYIRYEDADHPCGTVVPQAEGLLVGYTDRFSNKPDTDEFLGHATLSFLRICRAALALFEKAGPQAKAPQQAAAKQEALNTPPEQQPALPIDELFARADSLHAIGDAAAAEAALDAAKQASALDPRPFIKWTEAALQRKDWSEARRRSDVLRTRFPDDPHGYLLGARSSMQAGDHAAALDVAATAVQLFPTDRGLLETHAELATKQQNWPVAVGAWQRLQAIFPKEKLFALRLALSLWENRQFDESEAVLQEAARLFPNDPAIDQDLAFLAHKRRDLEEALKRWRKLRESYPERLMGYTFAALDLVYLGRIGEAETLLREAMARFPDSPVPWVDFARIPQDRGDWPEAATRWHAVRAQFPSRLDGYLMGALAARKQAHLDEAETLLLTAMEHFAHDPSPAVDYARLAQYRNDLPAAVTRWKTVVERFPGHADGYIGALAILRSLGRNDEAAELIASGIAAFPNLPRLQVEQAFMLSHAHRWTEAADAFAAVRARFPYEPAGYTGGADVCVSQGRLREAEELLEAGMKILPNAPTLALDHARIPSTYLAWHERDWDEAIRRMQAMCERFPDFEVGQLVAVRTLRGAGRLDEAEAIAAAAQRRMPKNIELALEFGMIAMERRDWAEAIRRFEHTKASFLGAVGAYVGIGEALSRLGRRAEAEAILEQAIKLFPDSSQPFDEYAAVAARQNDLRVALDRWQKALRRFPNESILRQRVFEGQLRLAELEAEPGRAERQKPAEVSGQQTPQEMISQFESLGGTLLGCEFGLLQRALGAEPLGLLRWTDMSVEDLIAVLNAEFSGVGEAEHTDLVIPEKDGRAEYMVRDRRFNMRMHTFVARDDAPADKLFLQLCRRLRFLKAKLIDDLRAGDKIFVFKITARDLTEAELARLHAAMRRYGDNTLLYVAYANESKPNGHVEVRAPGLLVGYIDRFATGRRGETFGPATVSWTALCRRALAVWHETRSEAQTVAAAQ